MENPYGVLAHDLENLPGNQKPEDQTTPEIKPVAKGERKTSVVKKIARSVFADDISNIREYLVYDILIPALKKAADEAFHSILYGRNSRAEAEKPRRDYASYSDYYSRSKPRTKETSTARFNDDFWFSSRRDAEEVLREITGVTEKFGSCTVAMLCRLSGLTSEWTDNDYGWTSLRGARVVASRGGFILDLPRAHILDDERK